MIAAVWNIGGALAQTSLDAVIIADSHGNVTAFNPEAQGMFGHARDHAVGRSIADSVVPEHHRSPHQAAMTRCMSGQPARVMGRRLETETRSTLCDDAGRMTGILSVARDVTRHHRAALAMAATARENAPYRRMFHAMPDSVYAKDRDGRFIAANPAISDALGAAGPEALIGTTDADWHPPQVAAA